MTANHIDRGFCYSALAQYQAEIVSRSAQSLPITLRNGWQSCSGGPSVHRFPVRPLRRDSGISALIFRSTPAMAIWAGREPSGQPTFGLLDSGATTAGSSQPHLPARLDVIPPESSSKRRGHNHAGCSDPSPPRLACLEIRCGSTTLVTVYCVGKERGEVAR